MGTENQNQNQNQEGEGNNERLYAGKFKSVEDLEAGYKSSAVVFDENTNLKKKLEEVTKVPDVYMNPSDLNLDQTRLSSLQQRAKDAGMTQEQYNKFVMSEKMRVETNTQNFENSKKEVGDETLNLLTDYVNKHYPKELQQNMINTFIVNKEARQAALNHRQQLLNNQVPGMNRVGASGGYHVSDKDVREAYAQKEKTKQPKDIQRYLNLVAAQAQQ